MSSLHELRDAGRAQYSEVRLVDHDAYNAGTANSIGAVAVL